MEKLSDIGFIKLLKEVAKDQRSLEIWQIAENTLPSDCPLRNGDTFHINALFVILELAILEHSIITEETICAKCNKQGHTICRR
ncbi:hypothetical protein K8R32_04130 [bacterium]|nr:hypothetical protein [bacterium]